MLRIKSFSIAGYSLLLWTCVQLFSCKQRKEIDVSGVHVEIQSKRLEQDLFLPPQKNISVLQKKYGPFFDLFCYRLTEMGTPDTALLKDRLNEFTTDADLREVFQSTEKIYHDFTSFDRQLADAFRHYKYYFPEKQIPQLYTFISGFNYSVVAADSALGIGVDMYLGADSKFYPGLQFPHYKIIRMRNEYLAADAMRGWIQSEWESNPEQSDLLSQMIYSGKISYMLDQLLPKSPDSIKTGYTASQLNWCKSNEKKIWSFLIDQKLLFSSDPNQVAKFISDGPTTNGFPKESPGGIGQWIGWRIIQSYMNNHSEETLNQLMNQNNYRKIFNDSKYKPSR
jgi:gliding motility-associated lipoprotein GldB